MTDFRSHSWFGLLIALALLLAPPAWSRRFPVEAPDVVALKAKVAAIREQANGGPMLLSMLKQVVLDNEGSSALRQAALVLLVDELRQEKAPPEFLLDLMDSSADRDLKNQIGFHYWVLLVDLESTPSGRIAQLTQLAQKGGFREDDFGTRKWAANRLCSMGVEAAWPVIEAIFSGGRSTDLEDRAYCRCQLAAMNEFSDPVAGLRKVLFSDDPLALSANLNGKLYSWAVDQLDQMATTRSLHLLAEYGARLSATNWHAGDEIAAKLKKHGFTEQTLRAYGFKDSPGHLRSDRP